VSNTIFFVEADKSAATEWTRPKDINFDPKNPKRHLGGLLPDGGINVVLGDSSAHTLSPDIDPEVLRRLIGISDGEIVDIEDFY